MKLLSCLRKHAVPKRIWQYLATLSSCLSVICTGMVYGWSSPALPLLLAPESPISMSSIEGYWLTVTTLFASVFGGALAFKIVDVIGRKKSILFVGIPYCISWLLIGFAKNIVLLYVARCLAGFADVLTYTVVPMYIGEISDPSIRGLLGSSVQIMLTLGLVLVNIIGVNFTVSQAGFICAIIPVLLIISFGFMPESPYYYIMIKEYKKAEVSLKTLRGVDDVRNELDILMVEVQRDMERSVDIWKYLKQARNLKSIGIMMGVRAFQQLSGISAIVFYTKMIFDQTDNFISANSSIYIYMVVMLIVSIFSSFIMDKTGRVPLIVVSTVGSSVCLMIIGIFFYVKTNLGWDVSNLGWIPVVTLIVFIIIYSVGLGIVPIVMLSEMFSTEIKAFALCFLDIYFAILVIIISKFFHFMMDEYGIYVPFCTFSITSIFGLVFIYFFVIETKGKTLEDIQKELRGETKEDNFQLGQINIRTISQ